MLAPCSEPVLMEALSDPNFPNLARLWLSFCSLRKCDVREKTPTAGVLSENTRAEYRAAELERVLKEDFAFQNKAHNLKTGFPEMDSYKDSLESGLREEQFRQDHRRTSCSCFHL